jgi:hypothetical protein
MSVFMVERSLAGISMDDLGGAQKAAIDKGEQMTATGTPVRYIRTTFTPEDGRCLCLFEAQSGEDVKRLNDEAGLPYDRVVPAMDLTPQ